MSSPQPPPQPPPPASTSFEDPPPNKCCYCCSTIGVGVRLPAWNEIIVTKKDHAYYFCSTTCKVGCNDAWSTAISFSSRSFPIDGVLGYTVRSPIPTWHEDILGVVAYSPLASKDEQNVFISVDGKKHISLPPTPCLP